MKTFSEQLADLAQGRDLDWSDAWSEQDMRDATAASVRRFEDAEEDAEAIACSQPPQS